MSTFVTRNMSYCLGSPRRAYATVKAMNAYRKKVGECEFAGCRSRHRFKPQVHHIQRVADAPELADKESNFIALCTAHHFPVGHGCSYHQSVSNVRELCESATITERD